MPNLGLQGRPPHYMVDAFIHVMPLIRDVVEWMGCLEVSKQGVHRVLDSKAAAMLVVGGQSEMLDSKSWDGASLPSKPPIEAPHLTPRADLRPVGHPLWTQGPPYPPRLG